MPALSDNHVSEYVSSGSSPGDVVRAFDLFYVPGHAVEVRAPKGGRYRTISGYFDDPTALVKAVAEIDAPSIYLTLNPVPASLLARSNNALKPYAEATTSDADIVGRRWLLIDIDPVRPAGISSSDAEHEASISLARTVYAWLVGEGVPSEAIVAADSGNGAHLLVRIELENTAEATELVNRLLTGLAAMFNTEQLKIDTKVGNAARITKLYGTLVKKGDSTEDRPHRPSRLLLVPGEIAVCPTEVLEQIAALAPAQPKPSSTWRQAFAGSFDIDAYIAHHAFELKGPKPWKGGRLWEFEVCPFDDSHEQNSATQLIQMESGAIAVSCHHERCKGKGWDDLKALYPPQRSSASAVASPGTEAVARLETIGAVQRKLGPRAVWLVGEMFAVGDMSILVAKPGVGKSTFAAQLAYCVAYGQPFLGRIVRRPGTVVYLAFEGARSTLAHMVRLGANPDDPHILVYRGEAEAKEPAAWLDSVLRDVTPVLIIVDTLTDLARARHGASNAGYEEMMAKLGAIYLWAQARRVHIHLLHHGAKGERDGIDAALGTIGIVGKPGTVLDYRLMSAKEPDGPRVLKGVKHREGDLGDLPPVVLDFDRETGLTVAGYRDDVALRELGTQIIQLVRRTPDIRQSELLEALEGRKTAKLEALRQLTEPVHGVLVQEGTPKSRTFPLRLRVRPDLTGDPVTIWRRSRDLVPENRLGSQNAGTKSSPTETGTFPLGSHSIVGVGNQVTTPEDVQRLGSHAYVEDVQDAPPADDVEVF